MWSNDAPDAAFLAMLESVFVDVQAEVVTFDNPYTDQKLAALSIRLDVIRYEGVGPRFGMRGSDQGFPL